MGAGGVYLDQAEHPDGLAGRTSAHQASETRALPQPGAYPLPPHPWLDAWAYLRPTRLGQLYEQRGQAAVAQEPARGAGAGACHNTPDQLVEGGGVSAGGGDGHALVVNTQIAPQRRRTAQNRPLLDLWKARRVRSPCTTVTAHGDSATTWADTLPR